jgi:hypothetical protein
LTYVERKKDGEDGVDGLAVTMSVTVSPDGNTYTVKGTGNDIWNAADSAQYAFVQVSGNFDISCRVASFGSTNTADGSNSGVTAVALANPINVVYDFIPSTGKKIAAADLTMALPSGWSDKMVVSTNAGDNTDDSPLYNDQNLFIDLAIGNIGSADAGPFITSLYVVIVPIIMWIFWRERPSPLLGLAVFLATAGGFLLSTAGAFSIKTGDLLILCSSFFWGMHVIVVGRANGKIAAIPFAFSQFIFIFRKFEWSAYIKS